MGLSSGSCCVTCLKLGELQGFLCRVDVADALTTEHNALKKYERNKKYSKTWEDNLVKCIITDILRRLTLLQVIITQILALSCYQSLNDSLGLASPRSILFDFSLQLFWIRAHKYVQICSNCSD